MLDMSGYSYLMARLELDYWSQFESEWAQWQMDRIKNCWNYCHDSLNPDFQTLALELTSDFPLRLVTDDLVEKLNISKETLEELEEIHTELWEVCRKGELEMMLE